MKMRAMKTRNERATQCDRLQSSAPRRRLSNCFNEFERITAADPDLDLGCHRPIEESSRASAWQLRRPDVRRNQGPALKLIDMYPALMSDDRRVEMDVRWM
jgi:hypothetical protein